MKALFLLSFALLLGSSPLYPPPAEAHYANESPSKAPSSLVLDLVVRSSFEKEGLSHPPALFKSAKERAKNSSLNFFSFTAYLFGGSIIAGMLGALTGLGGGVVLVPLLVLFMGVDMHYAMGASLISIIATSSGAAAAYVKQGFSNLRVGMFLECFTTTGAVCGAMLVPYIPVSTLATLFGFVLLYSALSSMRRANNRTSSTAPADPIASRLRMDSSYPSANGEWKEYKVYNIPGGSILMFIAGILSGLLGIGSGAVKVLAMDQAMHIPLKVSTTTSNFMIGVTAAASAGVYMNRGYVAPELVMPVMLGVLLGSFFGARLLESTKPWILRTLFTAVIFLLGIEMIYNGMMGQI